MSNINNGNIENFSPLNRYTETLDLIPDSIAGFNLKPYLQYVNRYPKGLPPAPKGFEYSSRVDSISDPYTYKIEDLPVQAHYIEKGLNNLNLLPLDNPSKYYRILPTSKDIDLNSKTIKYPRYLRPIKEGDYTEEDLKKAQDYNRQQYIDYYDSYINDFNNNPNNYFVTPTTVDALDISMMDNLGTRNSYNFAGKIPSTLGSTHHPGLGYQDHYMYDPYAEDVIDHFVVRPTKDDFDATDETSEDASDTDSSTDENASDTTGSTDASPDFNKPGIYTGANGAKGLSSTQYDELALLRGDEDLTELLKRELNKIDNLANSIPAYNPHTDTLYDSPLGNVTDLFQYDSPERIPMHNYTTYHSGGPSFFKVNQQRPDYFSNKWKNLELASSPQNTRLPLSNVKSNKKDAMSSNLVVPVTYNGEQKYVTTLDRLLKDSLRINGLEAKTNRIGDLLSLSIGDARRENLKKYYEDAMRWWWLPGSYDKKLRLVHNLSLPINIGDFPLGRYGAKGYSVREGTAWNRFHPLTTDTVLDKMYPSEYAYHKHGIVNVEPHFMSHYNPAMRSIGINEQEQPSKLGNKFLSLLANRRDRNMSPELYAQKLNRLGIDLHNNDVPANALHYYLNPRSRFLNSLKHEGDHAMTTYLDRVPLSSLHNTITPRTYNDQTIFERGLGTIERKPGRSESPYSPYNYSLGSTAEALRSLHDFKVGWARHLAATTNMTPQQIVAKVQDPDAALLFMDYIYGAPSEQGQKYYAKSSFNFPSTMAPKATELTTARSIRGLEPIYKYVTGKPTLPNPYEDFYDPIRDKMRPNRDGTYTRGSKEEKNWLKYKANLDLRDGDIRNKFLNQKQRKQFWDIIYPQVNNNLYTNSNNNMV